RPARTRGRERAGTVLAALPCVLEARRGRIPGAVGHRECLGGLWGTRDPRQGGVRVSRRSGSRRGNDPRRCGRRNGAAELVLGSDGDPEAVPGISAADEVGGSDPSTYGGATA